MQSPWLSEVDSTNDELKRRLQSTHNVALAHGTWVGATVQTRGRGRADRKWVSAAGNLYFSQYLEFNPTRLITWLPLLVGAVLRDLLSQRSRKELRIKWPNDLWIVPDQLKCAGILCEGFSIGSRHGVIVGVGANLVSEPQAPGAGVVGGWDAHALAEALSGLIGATWESDVATQFHWTRAQLQQWGLFKQGVELEVLGQDGTPSRIAQFAGYGESGELLVQSAGFENPELQALWSEEVRVRPHSLKSR